MNLTFGNERRHRQECLCHIARRYLLKCGVFARSNVAQTLLSVPGGEAAHSPAEAEAEAGLGITEESDAIAIIVSEETGGISICHRRRIERNFTPETFRQRIAELLLHRDYEEADSEKLAREVDLPPARDHALVPDQKERSDDAVAVCDEAGGERKAEKSGPAGDDDFHDAFWV